MPDERRLHSNAAGFFGMSGALHALAQALDGAFVDLALSLGAEREEFGPLLAVSDLRKIDYFSAFPQLVMFPAHAGREHVAQFARANGAGASGPLVADRLDDIDAVLAPAACYAVYIAASGTTLSQAKRITVKGTCFRKEESLVPLVRQTSFRMREIVHLGSRATIASFLSEARERVLLLARALGLSTSIEKASDPFFDPARSPKYLHATLFPSKHELVSGGVAIGSFNDHRNFFGEAFGIDTAEGAAHTACVAFGIERWVHAVLETHGANPADWPMPKLQLKAATCSA
jgi:seryl-tRNA synthetase